MWPAVLPTCVYWPHLHSRSTWDEFEFSSRCFCQQGYKNIKLAHVWDRDRPETSLDFNSFLLLFFYQQGYKTIKLAHVWKGKSLCTNVASNFALVQFTISSIYKKLISSSPRRWLVSERTVCSCTLRPRSWLLPGCCQYEYICDFLICHMSWYHINILIMMRLSSLIVILVISSHSQELEPQRLLQVRPIQKNHYFGVILSVIIPMKTIITKESLQVRPV